MPPIMTIMSIKEREVHIMLTVAFVLISLALLACLIKWIFKKLWK